MVPFYRTIKQAKQNGFVKTSSMTLALSLRYAYERMKYLPEKSVVKVNNSRMLVSPREGGINRDLFLYKKREPLCTEYLIHSSILKRGSIVLDIGANMGYYVLLESQLVGKTGKVYAVEPVSSTFELLEKNMQLNNVSNVSAFKFAFGEKADYSEIYLCKESNLCAMNKKTVGGKIVGKQKVPVKTVDDFFKGKDGPNFIRMDVEGYEYQIFKGMTETLKGNVRILVELHYGRQFIDPEKMDELFHILEENSFRVRFAIFEDKVEVENNRVVRSLLNKAGYELPIVFSNISLLELKKVLEATNAKPRWPPPWPPITGRDPMCPNVLFEKVSAG
jgi:FkbM family methyltransferase